jgi:anti-anti-sigma factor
MTSSEWPRPGQGRGGEQAMGDYGLAVEVRHEPGHVLVTVAGEVDIGTVDQLQEPLAALAASGRPLIIDLDLVTFIGAAGLRVLARAASQAAAHGASLHVVCARYQVRQLFAITGLDCQIPLARTVTEACQSLAAAWGHPRQRPPPARPPRGIRLAVTRTASAASTHDLPRK